MSYYIFLVYYKTVLTKELHCNVDRSQNLFQGLNKFCCSPNNDLVFNNFFEELERSIIRLRLPLQNKPKDAAHRAAINKIGEQLTISEDRKVVIDESIRNEAIALSDLFNIDELDSIELVITGEIQARNFRDLPRCLCAIVCYYDAHRYFCLLLKSLLAFHANQLYCNESSEKIRKLTTNLLADKNLFCNLLDTFSTFSVAHDLNGSAIHQWVVLGDLVTKQHCVRPLQRKVFTIPQLAAWTSLLLFINPVRLKQQCDGSIDIFNHFKKLVDESWADECLRATVLLAFGVAVKYARSSLGLSIPHQFNDHDMIDKAIAQNALEFIQVYILVPKFERFSFLVDVLDSLVKNFLCYFREKLHEMYNLCEEELYSLTEEDRENRGITLSTYSNLHFKSMIELITNLYEPDTPQIEELSQQFTDPKCEALRTFVLSGKAISAPRLSIAYLSMLKALCKNEKSSGFIFNMFR
uniref:Uncharacterized protein n=1 Tax=Ditylenchus dipsaci TaxID=166011 RepID=A0A915EIR7_9BILA